jgi:predicted HTH domain antitoxin
MEVQITLPDDIAVSLQSLGDIPRRMLESLAIEGIQAGKLTVYQVQRMLGFQTRFEVDGFLKERGVFFDYSPEELRQELETIQMLKEARAAQ